MGVDELKERELEHIPLEVCVDPANAPLRICRTRLRVDLRWAVPCKLTSLYLPCSHLSASVLEGLLQHRRSLFSPHDRRLTPPGAALKQ